MLLLCVAKVWLSLVFTLFHLAIWLSRLMALVFFLLTKVALVFLPPAHFGTLTPPFSIRRTLFVSSFSAEAGAILLALRWSRQHHFSALSDSHSVLSSIFPFTSNSLAHLAGTVLFSFLVSGYSGSTDIHFFQERCD